jgi:hypothetical protein
MNLQEFREHRLLFVGLSLLIGMNILLLQNCTKGSSGSSSSTPSNGCVTTGFGSACGDPGTLGGLAFVPPPGAHGYFYKLTPLADPNGFANGQGEYPSPVDGSMSLLTSDNVIPGLQFYATEINVPLQPWTSGFPGFADLQEWFGLCYDANWTAAVDGDYTFVTAVDDAAALWIDGQLVGENDDGDIGTVIQVQNTGHGPGPDPRAFDPVHLSAGTHSVKIMYYQGWPVSLAVQIWALPPGTPFTDAKSLSPMNLMQLAAPASGAMTCPH